MSATVDSLGLETGRTATVWDEYLRIDTALSQSFFTSQRAGMPVYLDMDDESFDNAAISVNLSREELRTQLVASVRSSLSLDSSRKKVFEIFDAKLRMWKGAYRSASREGDPLPIPPVTALLAVFTLAAERMGDREFANVHDNAYYPHLTRLLEVPENDIPRFIASFRASSESYWDALRAWLEGVDGNYGLPSAYALSHRFIGLPISQALIRDTERRQLKKMFGDMALPSRTGISQQDMEISLGQWIALIPSPASSSLRQLWVKPEARSRIVDIAIGEFDAWDGVSIALTATGTSQPHQAVTRCLLAIAERTENFASRIDLAFVLPTSAVGGDSVSVETSDGPIDVTVTSIGSRYSGTTSTSAGLDAASLLTNVLTVHAGERHDYVRFPRRVVPFVRDAFANVYIETERVLVGENIAVLVKDVSALVEQVRLVLADTARPGFDVKTEANGAPLGWVLFSNLQILASPQESLLSPDLEWLVPRLSTQMTLSGGLRLPGRIARWSALDQPELSVSSDQSRLLGVTCILQSLDDVTATVIELAAPQQAPFVINLSSFGLELGDYVITLSSGTTPLQTHTLRLRSSDERDQFSWNKIQQIGHYSDHALWPIQASSAQGDLLVDGAFVDAPEVTVSPTDYPSSTGWRTNISGANSRKVLFIDSSGAAACSTSGAHKTRYPTFTGKPAGRWVFGTCSECGLTKRDPASYRDRLLARRETAASGRAISAKLPSSLTPLSRDANSWRAAVDAVFYLGTGSSSDLRSIARQIEDSALFESRFIRSLESLGTIETTRDDNFRVISFEVAATCLAELANGNWLLTGVWSAGSISALEEVIAALGGSSVTSTLGGPHLTCLSNIDGVELAEEREETRVSLVEEAGIGLLSTLPALSVVGKGLPRRPMDFASGAEIFVPASAGWQPVSSTDRPGTYRTKSAFEARYFFRDQADVDQGLSARVPFDLAKHLAAQMNDQPLHAYAASSQQFRVPLGANLPGLYERAAVLCSGELPTYDRATNSIVYGSINEPFASALAARLSR
jgi:hypothetical protein